MAVLNRDDLFLFYTVLPHLKQSIVILPTWKRSVFTGFLVQPSRGEITKPRNDDEANTIH